MSNLKIRAGERKEGSVFVPANAKVFKSKSGRDCYMSGLKMEGNRYIASIKYIDDNTFTEVDYNLIAKYL